MSQREREQRAAELVRIAASGELGQAGADLVALFREAHQRGAHDKRRAVSFEREANALAAVLAQILDGAHVDDVADDLPHDARRRVIAFRHQSGPVPGLPAQDQFGPLPRVPPRASVLRNRTRVIDI